MIGGYLVLIPLSLFYLTTATMFKNEWINILTTDEDVKILIDEAYYWALYFATPLDGI